MRFEPHGYQRHAIDWILEHPACALFLEMGLGKTVITLTAIDQLLNDQFEVSRVLVIAPLRVAETTWSGETSKWDHLKHLRISKILGDRQERETAIEAKADIWVINRENVAWLVETVGDAWPWDLVVIDELSSFKSSKATRFRALRKVRKHIRRVVGLTGTPAPNGLLDLWPQVYLLDCGERLGKTVTGYRERYFEPDRRSRTVIYSWKPRPFADDAIYSKLADICLSMTAGDWLELPERIDRSVTVSMSNQERDAYLRMERTMVLDHQVTAGSAAILAGKLLQLANGAVYTDEGKVLRIHERKLDALDDLIEAANGRPVLVYYSYRHDMVAIKGRHPEAVALDSEDDIRKWNEGRIQLMLAHPASAGHGLNLQDGGEIIVWYGLPWSLELYQQANARLHRQGQRRAVIVHHIVNEGTIDHQVMDALSDKAAGQDRLIEAVKARVERYLEVTV